MTHENKRNSNQPNGERNKPKGCFTLSREILVALENHHAHTGKAKSTTVETALRIWFGMPEAPSEKSTAPTKIV